MQSMQSFGAVEIFATEMLIAVHVLFLTQGNIWGISIDVGIHS